MPREIDVFLPARFNDGSPVPEETVKQIEDHMTETFGGFTHLKNHNVGVWKMGGVVFHDEITILRVIDERGGAFDGPGLKKKLQALLKQESVLIVVRNVEIV